MNKFSFIVFVLLGLSLCTSCSTKKKLTELKEENTKLNLQVDSLSNELVLKTLALSQAQKTINQLSTKKTSTTRKKIDASNGDRVSFFIQNIVKYIDWQPDNYFLLGVVGDDKLYEKLLNQFKGKKVADRHVVVKKMNSSKEVEFCNMYYLSSSKLTYLDEIQRKSKNNAFIMSDVLHSSEGIHLNFYIENESLHFDLNDDELKKCQLVVSSSLKNLVK
jgi:YfiR/HmsC-like